MSRRRYTTTDARLRRWWAAQLPQPCCRCGAPVTATDRWHVDHWPVALADGGTRTRPAHGSCNERAGQQWAVERRRPRPAEGHPIPLASRAW